MEKEGEKVDAKKVGDLHRFAETIKKDNYLLQKVRRMTAAFDWADLDPKQLEMMKVWAANPENQKLGLVPPGVKILQQKPSAFGDKAKIDAAIMKKKENLTDNEKTLLDYIILVTYRRGNLKNIEELETALALEGDLPIGLKDILGHLKKEAAKTNLGRVGINAQAVDNQSVTDFTRSYLEQLDTTWKPPSQEQLKSAHSKIDKVKETVKKDNNGDNIMEDEFEPWIEATT